MQKATYTVTTRNKTIRPIHRMLVEWAVRQSLLNSKAYRLALSGGNGGESDMWAEKAANEWSGKWASLYGQSIANEMRGGFVGMYVDVLELAAK
jgi:hypothetical protein